MSTTKPMAPPLTMPERLPGDGGVSVTRFGNGDICIATEGRSKAPYVCSGSLIVSPFNAWRIVGMLCVLMTIPMAKAFAKACKTGPDLEAKFR